jgi:hypothetical protein
MRPVSRGKLSSCFSNLYQCILNEGTDFKAASLKYALWQILRSKFEINCGNVETCLKKYAIFFKYLHSNILKK